MQKITSVKPLWQHEVGFITLNWHIMPWSKEITDPIRSKLIEICPPGNAHMALVRLWYYSKPHSAIFQNTWITGEPSQELLVFQSYSQVYQRLIQGVTKEPTTSKVLLLSFAYLKFSVNDLTIWKLLRIQEPDPWVTTRIRIAFGKKWINK